MKHIILLMVAIILVFANVSNASSLRNHIASSIDTKNSCHNTCDLAFKQGSVHRKICRTSVDTWPFYTTSNKLACIGMCAVAFNNRLSTYFTACLYGCTCEPGNYSGEDLDQLIEQFSHPPPENATIFSLESLIE